MPKFRIGVKEVWEQMYEVKADTKEEAIQNLKNSMFFGGEDEHVAILENEFSLCNIQEGEGFVVYD